MRFIDKELKIFGTIYLFDFIALIFIGFAFFAIVFVTPRKRSIPNEEFTSAPDMLNNKWVEVYGRNTSVLPEVAKIIKEGDKEILPNGTVSAIIDKIISMEDEDFDARRKQSFKNVMIRFKVRVFKHGKRYFTKNIQIKIGTQTIFKADMYDLSYEIIKFGATSEGNIE